jgi:hypothetical protein
LVDFAMKDFRAVDNVAVYSDIVADQDAAVCITLVVW